MEDTWLRWKEMFSDETIGDTRVQDFMDEFSNDSSVSDLEEDR